MWAPSVAKDSAVARPMPLAAPVITAMWFWRLRFMGGCRRSFVWGESREKFAGVRDVAAIGIAESIDEFLFFDWGAGDEECDDKQAGGEEEPIGHSQDSAEEADEAGGVEGVAHEAIGAGDDQGMILAGDDGVGEVFPEGMDSGDP